MKIGMPKRIQLSMFQMPSPFRATTSPQKIITKMSKGKPQSLRKDFVLGMF